MSGDSSSVASPRDNVIAEESAASFSASFKDENTAEVEVAASIELPSDSQSSDSEDELINDEATIPVDHRIAAGAGLGAASDSDVISFLDSDEGENGHDARSVHLSEYDSADAISFVETCSSASNFSDSNSSSSDDDHDVISKRKRRKRRSGACISRRRTSNSDSSDDESAHDGTMTSDGTATRNPSEDLAEDDVESVDSGESDDPDDDHGSSAEKKVESENSKDNTTSTDNIESIWDVDCGDLPRSRPVNNNRKLWSDQSHNQSMPAGSRFQSSSRRSPRYTNSFHDRSRVQRQGAFSNRPAFPNNCPQFPPQFGLGLGRGITRNDPARRFDCNVRPPGPLPNMAPWNYTQNRRANSPYCHYQQQQRFFGMPRGSYASVVQKAPPTRNVRQGSSYSTQETSHGATRNPNFNRQKENNPTNFQQQSQQYQPQRQNSVRQSYNRGKATAAQILQQQRQQQEQRQELQQQKQTPSQQGAAKPQTWQPPSGPGVQPLRIGGQVVYIVHPSSNRPTIAQEDPCIITAVPPTPNPYIVLPGGARVPIDARGDNAIGGGVPQPSFANSVGIGKELSSEALHSVCPVVGNKSSSHTRLPAFNALPSLDRRY